MGRTYNATHESVTVVTCTVPTAVMGLQLSDPVGMSVLQRLTTSEICHAGTGAPSQHDPPTIATSLPKAAPGLTASTHASSKPPSVVRLLCLLLKHLAILFRAGHVQGLPLGDSTILPISYLPKPSQFGS